MKKNLFLIAMIFAIAACGDPNHYDYHAGQKPDPAVDHDQDTIQGRAADSTTVVTDSTNTDIGDTTIQKMSH